MLQKQSEAFPTFLWHFPSLKQTSIAYYASKVSSRPDCIFEIHLLWLSGFSRVYFYCCCSCSFEREILKISQLSQTMYIHNILNFQGSTTILDACTKMSGNLLNAPRMLSCSLSLKSLQICFENFRADQKGSPKPESCHQNEQLVKELFFYFSKFFWICIKLLRSLALLWATSAEASCMGTNPFSMQSSPDLRVITEESSEAYRGHQNEHFDKASKCFLIFQNLFLNT